MIFLFSPGEMKTGTRKAIGASLVGLGILGAVYLLYRRTQQPQPPSVTVQSHYAQSGTSQYQKIRRMVSSDPSLKASREAAQEMITTFRKKPGHYLLLLTANGCYPCKMEESFFLKNRNAHTGTYGPLEKELLNISYGNMDPKETKMLNKLLERNNLIAPGYLPAFPTLFSFNHGKLGDYVGYNPAVLKNLLESH